MHFVHSVRRSVQCQTVCRRFIINAAYKCDEQWNARNSQPPLNYLDAGTFLSDAQKKVVAEGTVNAPTLDMAASIISDPNEFQIVRMLLYKLRHSRQCHRILDSTQRSIILHAIQLKQELSIVQMIQDPINFGLFPDTYSVNILMDHFLETKQYEYAARMAVYVMHQEMFDNPLTCILSVESCLQWLNLGAQRTWSQLEIAESVPQQVKSSADQEEEIYFKVPFLKNRTFDNHFDVTDSLKLVGKSLAWNARALPDSELTLNAQLLGYILFDDQQQAEQVASQVKKKLLFKDFIEFLPSNSNKQEREPEAKESDAEDIPEADWKVELVDELKTFGVTESSFIDSAHKQVINTAEKTGRQDVEDQINMFNIWTQQINQQMHLQSELERKQNVIAELESELADMKKEEELITFFDKRDEWEQAVPSQLLDKEVSKRIDIKKLTDEEYAKVIPDPSRYRKENT